MVDLKAKPYCLPDEDVRWVEETIAGMTPEEKERRIRGFLLYVLRL